jgi:hypothetical protein
MIKKSIVCTVKLLAIVTFVLLQMLAVKHFNVVIFLFNINRFVGLRPSVALSENIRLGKKYLTATNALAYCAQA